MEKDYVDILCKNILNAVKDKIRYNNIILEKDKELEMDKKMLEIIQSIVLYNKNNFIEQKSKIKDWKKEISPTVLTSLVHYYVALYNDNLELLHKLLEDGIKIGTFKDSKINLFMLEKRFSSQFDYNEYKIALNNHMNLFEKFYYILNNNKIDQNKLIEKFCNLIKMYMNANKKEDERLLTIELLTNLTENEILNLTDNQKQNLLWNSYNSEDIKKMIFDLIKKDNFSKVVVFWDFFTKYFTREEFLNLTQEEIDLYENLYASGANFEIEELNEFINRLKELKRINPNFNYKLDALFYDNFTNKQILNLSESVINSINELVCNYKIGIHSVENTPAAVFLEKFIKLQLKYYIKEYYYKDRIKTNLKGISKKKTQKKY